MAAVLREALGYLVMRQAVCQWPGYLPCLDPTSPTTPGPLPNQRLCATDGVPVVRMVSLTTAQL